MALHEHKPLINLTIAASIVGQGRKLMARTRTEKKKRLLGSPASSFRIQWFINYSGQLILNHYPKLRPFWVGFVYCSTTHPLWVSDLVQPMPPQPILRRALRCAPMCRLLAWKHPRVSGDLSVRQYWSICLWPQTPEVRQFTLSSVPRVQRRLHLSYVYVI